MERGARCLSTVLAMKSRTCSLPKKQADKLHTADPHKLQWWAHGRLSWTYSNDHHSHDIDLHVLALW